MPLWPASGYGVVLLFNAGSPMMLDQIGIVHGVFDIVEGTAPPAKGPGLAATLLALWLNALRAWRGDDGPDLPATMAAVDRWLERALRAGKFFSAWME